MSKPKNPEHEEEAMTAGSKSERDQRVHQLRADGKTEREIAAMTGIPKTTVAGILKDRSKDNARKREARRREREAQQASKGGGPAPAEATPADAAVDAPPPLEQHAEPEASTVVEAAMSLDDLAGRVKAEHEGVVAAVRTSLEHARRAGELLLAARPLCPHGTWLSWLRDEVKISQATAWGYMQVAQHWAKLSTADNLRQALRLLTEKEEPPALAPAAVIDQQSAGEGKPGPETLPPEGRGGFPHLEELQAPEAAPEAASAGQGELFGSSTSATPTPYPTAPVVNSNNVTVDHLPTPSTESTPEQPTPSPTEPEGRPSLHGYAALLQTHAARVSSLAMTLLDGDSGTETKLEALREVAEVQDAASLLEEAIWSQQLGLPVSAET